MWDYWWLQVTSPQTVNQGAHALAQHKSLSLLIRYHDVRATSESDSLGTPNLKGSHKSLVSCFPTCRSLRSLCRCRAHQKHCSNWSLGSWFHLASRSGKMLDACRFTWFKRGHSSSEPALHRLAVHLIHLLVEAWLWSYWGCCALLFCQIKRNHRFRWWSHYKKVAKLGVRKQVK